MTTQNRINKLIRITKGNLTDMQCIMHGGFMIDNETFRMMLKNNDHLQNRFDTLQNRLFKLNRIQGDKLNVTSI